MLIPADQVAREVLAERYPRALAAALAGSAARRPYAVVGESVTSDIDLILLIPEPPAHRETLRHQGRLVEVFAHTEDSFHLFAERETALRRSPTLHMWATGVLLVDQSGVGTELQVEASARFAAGPPPLGRVERDDLRYRVTDLLDDLVGAGRGGEAVFVAARLVTAAAELALSARGRWLGSGKWLWRRLRAAEPELADELVHGSAEVAAGRGPDRLRAAVATVLDRVGGPLREGYRR